jgi:ABC-type multidrug transport system permease subunit
MFLLSVLDTGKVRGNVQALLSTPIEPRDIWLGKSLAVFFPGLVFAVLLTIVVFLVLNFIYFVPNTGFIVTPWMLISNLVAVPLLYLALTLLVNVIGLTGKPGTGNVISQIFLPVIIALMINLAVRDVPSAGSWLFTVILLGIAVLLGIIVCYSVQGLPPRGLFCLTRSIW